MERIIKMNSRSGKQLLVIASLLLLIAAASRGFFNVMAQADDPGGVVQKLKQKQTLMVGGVNDEEFVHRGRETKPYKPPSGPNPKGNRLPPSRQKKPL